MERSGNFYKAIRLGYILISILIGCMAYNSLYEWQEIEALELGNKKIDELRKEINNINIQMIKFSLLGETISRPFGYMINEQILALVGVIFINPALCIIRNCIPVIKLQIKDIIFVKWIYKIG